MISSQLVRFDIFVLNRSSEVFVHDVPAAVPLTWSRYDGEVVQIPTFPLFPINSRVTFHVVPFAVVVIA